MVPMPCGAWTSSRLRWLISISHRCSAVVVGRSSSGEAASHAGDGSPADDRLGDGGVAFVLTGRSAAGGLPGQRSFHHPTAGDDAEAALASRLAHDLQGGAQGLAAPVHQPAGKPLVSEDVPDRRGQVRRQQGGLGTIRVTPAGGQHRDRDQQAAGVGDDRPCPGEGPSPRQESRHQDLCHSTWQSSQCCSAFPLAWPTRLPGGSFISARGPLTPSACRAFPGFASPEVAGRVTVDPPSPVRCSSSAGTCKAPPGSRRWSLTRRPREAGYRLPSVLTVARTARLLP
ncbi:hypothetical protein B0I32_13742 [Nonomuraea fuscirosea]|uniref:Uncharacterized protein n=1 Tax=Nonomuraea fuscirosea TaxID=1291556 RepID=A0A2T0M1X4_9ACTN|nr:hypothetical protein B0I32_13742 [Nonomuraea fuscirosea]